MKVVKYDLSDEINLYKIYSFADWHIGDAQCDLKSIINMVESVRKEPSAVILNGDLLNNATKDSVSDCYSENISPNDQIKMLTGILEPIRNEILFADSGNHESRSYRKVGIDMMEMVMANLGLSDRYAQEGGVVFLRFGHESDHGRKIRYSLYCTHGIGGGKKEGGKINQLSDLASIVDTDIYIHSHTHLPMTMKENYFRVDNCNSTVQEVTKLFVNTSAQLKYGGYGQQMGMKPSCLENPVIYLDGTKKEMKAIL